jgi:hypothetical protein
MMHQMNRSVGRRERVLVAGNDGQIMVCTYWGASAISCRRGFPGRPREAHRRAGTPAGRAEGRCRSALPRTWVSVDRGGFQQVGTPGDEARFGGQRPRRTVGWTGRVDVGTIVVIGIVAPVLVTLLIPSSALWTSGIVCNTPSHLRTARASVWATQPAGPSNVSAVTPHTPPANSRSTRFRPWSARSCCAAP